MIKQKNILPNFSLIHPDSIEARLQRYIVLSYPNEKALAKGKVTLDRNPNIISALENKQGKHFLTTPNDEFFLDIDTYQWGMFALNLENTWDKTTGHAYIGVPDSGLDIGTNYPSSLHPDLTNYRPQFSTSVIEDGNINSNSTHGSHVTGIIAATSNNQEGAAGVCWDCSIAFVQAETSGTHMSQSYNYLADVGVQVINSSWKVTGSDDNGGQWDCIINPFLSSETNAFCEAVALLKSRDIMVVAASGNGSDLSNRDNSVALGDYIQFPASDPYTISVGAIDISGNRALFSDYSNKLDLVAPGVNVHSTFTRGDLGNPEWYCGEGFGPGGLLDGYGNCSGTSMSTPHITGILGLMRSTDPLMKGEKIKEILCASAPSHDPKDTETGHGLPDALVAINSLLGTVNGAIIPNRLTPLFSFYGAFSENSFYTTVPQMAWTAITGTLPPLISTYAISQPAYGLPISHYDKFPHDETGNPPQPQPLAEVYIFTTKHNPIIPSQDLVPLYRLSNQGTYNYNVYNMNHTYTTEQSEVALAISFGAKLDGIEGYVFSSQYAQPAGTEKLLRRYNIAKDDHAIFPESKLTAMSTVGYNVIDAGSTGHLGYVYLNEDADNDSLIDGFERAIGTCLYDTDSDNDGILDGDEIVTYPYSDPLDPVTTCGSTILPEYTWKNNATGILYSNITWNYAMGYHFTPQVNGIIDQLGGYFNGTKTVKLFNTSTGVLLGQTTASANNSWGYGSVAPVTVQAGTQYTVAVYLNGSGATYRSVGNTFPNTYDSIKIDGTTFAPTWTDPNARPTNIYTNYMFGQADIRFTPL